MKRSAQKIIFKTLASLFLFGSAVAEAKGQTQIVSTIFVNGTISPLVTLSEVKVNAAGLVPEQQVQTIKMAPTDTIKLVKMESHLGVNMPAVDLQEAVVIAAKPQAVSASGLSKALQFIVTFIATYVSHNGNMQ